MWNNRSNRSSGSFNRGGSSYNRRKFAPRRNAFRGDYLDESTFINKNVEPVEETPHVSTMVFADFQIEEQLKKTIAERGYITPTPIQENAIPHVLEKKDVIGIADTGTGKTAAFLIPIINHLIQDSSEKALIIVPTRELALQIQQEFRLFTYGLDYNSRLFSTLCIGGSDIQKQIFFLRKTTHVVIGTPGRLKDLIERGVLKLSEYKTVVLDEVDRMVDMGFLPDISFLISQLPEKRQSLFFSATITDKVKNILNSFIQTEAVTVTMQHSTSDKNIYQDIVRVGRDQRKQDVLEELLRKEDFKKVLIFGKTKHGVEDLSQGLHRSGFKVASIHGDKRQNQRHMALKLFKSGAVNILVATDVAARGIDVPDITHVINYDKPSTKEDYVHRIGRAGRAQKKGVALTFV